LGVVLLPGAIKVMKVERLLIRTRWSAPTAIQRWAMVSAYWAGDTFSFAQNPLSIAAAAALDGIYVVGTNLTAG
jgi:hypothetical protein